MIGIKSREIVHHETLPSVRARAGGQPGFLECASRAGSPLSRGRTEERTHERRRGRNERRRGRTNGGEDATNGGGDATELFRLRLAMTSRCFNLKRTGFS